MTNNNDQVIKTTTSEKTKIIPNFPFVEDNWQRPETKIVSVHQQFLEIANPYLNLVSQHIINNLKQLEAAFGIKSIGKINAQVNKTFNELRVLRNQINNRRQLFTDGNGHEKKYSVINFINYVDRKILSVIEIVNEFIEKHRGLKKRFMYATSLDEYHKIINSEINSLFSYFESLEENKATDDAIPQKLLLATKKNDQKRKQKILEFKANFLNLAPKPYVNKQTKQIYPYGLHKFYKNYDKLKFKVERTFWENEVVKVDLLNKPHQANLKQNYKSTDFVIDLQNVVKYYSNGVTTNKVLKGVNLQIPPGEFVVILGPSGSGKTTLLNIISGMDRASSGKTIVAGEDLLTFSDTKLTNFRRKNVGYIFQQYGLLPNLTVKENIEIGAHLQPNAALRLNIDELLKDIGMYEHRNRLPAELSGGQQQRVSIIRAISKNPKIIFGDEPTGALDEKMTQIVLEQFVEINKKYKSTLVIVTHNPLIAEIATFVVKVSDGTIKLIVKNSRPKKVSEVKWGGE